MASKPDSATETLGNRKIGGDAPNSIPDNQLAEKSAGDVKNTLQNTAGTTGNNNEKNSLKIRIELDLEVEVHLTARVKGDITIGLL